MSQVTSSDTNVATYDKNMRPNAVFEGSLAWYSPKDAPFRVAGLAWFAQEQRYRRFLETPAYPLPKAVEYLGTNPSGGQIRFKTNSKHLSVRVRLSAVAGMVHMPATGQCGVDCYLGEPGKQRFLSVTKYDLTKAEYECIMFDFEEADMREVTLNLPLYQGVEEILIGLDPEADILPFTPYEDPRPIVVYGTSITQGGCACRPGMSYTNILSRRINREFINMGFSGNGKGEPDVARNLALIPNPGCYVLDYEANVSLEVLRETLPEFIRILREAHPTVPILVVSKIAFAREWAQASHLNNRLGTRAIQQETVQALRQQGDAQIFFLDGSTFLGDDYDECTVDGVHPSDLGFQRMADGIEPTLREILP